MSSKSKSKTADGEKKKRGQPEWKISDELAEIVGAEQMSRPQVVKHLWIYIKDKDLQNPENKREILCDDKLKSLFECDKISMFQMNKVLGKHFLERA
mmetsp:Transcript_53/g.56  ORF Transcript_53/g.56 Transcript_53/m.56 type:complete len:97 (-) Transcript_53:183-473(-)|eukprot:CAMPEP_0117757850 /NCGR_PEP_ID=MMETSP0947-20121206/15000_1 /TAXON_ID=44440 /ORGANISM="Chattonella subsalsa, Strain CCMP2191" /LENGTH=96 /DNA_ID=CAMNT_0005577869 /DNA_START=113 /DNA_END=403 /DNA_ORIENTATION=-